MIRGVHLTPIGNNSVLLEPGDSLDPGSPDDYLVELMDVLQHESANTLIYDLKNVPLIDRIYFSWLVRLHYLCQLGNIDMIVVNIRTTAAFSLATSITDSIPFKCALDVESARHGVVVTL